MSRAPSEAQAFATSPGASALTAPACSGCDSQPRTSANGRPMRRPTQILSPSKGFQSPPPSVGPMTRLLVTGGAGFIGSNFTRRAVEQGHDVVVLDKLTYAGNQENLRDLLDAKKIDFVKGDVCDRGLVDRLAKQAEAVVHFAAETHVDRSILEAGDFVQTDVVGTYSVLEACRKADVDRMVHISTDEVYGEAEGGPCREDAPLMPKSPYAASKAGADRLAFSYFATYGLPVVISRCTNNYGPYQHPEKLIPLFVTNALEDKPLPVYGTGKNTRDWIHVDDH